MPRAAKVVVDVDALGDAQPMAGPADAQAEVVVLEGAQAETRVEALQPGQQLTPGQQAEAAEDFRLPVASGELPGASLGECG